MAYNVRTTSTRAPTIAVPGSKGNSRPAPQKGGGGDKAAGSVEPTAANTPTVTVAPSGAVSTEHFVPQHTGPSPTARRATREAHAAAQEARRSRRRVQRVRSYVRQRDKELAPKREVKISKDFLDKAASPKPVTVAAHTRKLPGSEAPRAKPVKVATHQRKLPKQPELKGTPEQRQQVRKELKQAKRQVIRSQPQISGLTNKAQEEFAEQLSKKTGIPPKLAGEWVRQESGASAAGQGGQAGEQNELGVGYPAHPTSFSESSYFNHTTPRKAANATAAWMEGKIGQEFGYKAAPSIQQIPRLAKSGASEQQIRRYIEGPSRWGTGQIAQSGVTATPGNPQALQNYKAVAKKAKSLGMKVGPALPDVQVEGGTHTIKVRADAKGTVEWAEAQINVQENSGKQLKWAANEGLPQGAPWCANFASNDLARRGFSRAELPANPNYSGTGGGYETWAEEGRYATNKGTDLAQAKPGDILTFSGEHTAIYVGNGEMISGNFSDEVMKTPVSEGPAPLSMIIEPHYKGGWVKVKESTPLPGTTSATGSLVESAAPAAVSAVSATDTAPEKPRNGKPVPGKKLTPFQELTRRVKKLQSLGVEVALPGQETKAEAANKPGDSSLHQQLAALEKKYSVGAV